MLQCCGLVKPHVEAEVNENLGTYVQCLGELDRKIWRIEELQLRKDVGIKVIDDQMLEALKDSTPHNRQIKNVPNYQITSNPKYAAYY